MTLYISKKIEDADFLTFLSENNLAVEDVPMISFEPRSFEVPNNAEYDAVFFTSPRSVQFFLEKVKIDEGILIATIGSSTAEIVQKYGYHPDFVGKHSGKPNEVAKSFKAEIGDRKVLFPQSSRSKRSVQSSLKPEQCIDLVVYETLLEPEELKVFPEILVFTSPSNVEAFLMKNDFDSNQKIIAWGDSTAHYLEKNGASSTFTLEKSSLKNLQLTLEKMLDIN